MTVADYPQARPWSRSVIVALVALCLGLLFFALDYAVGATLPFAALVGLFAGLIVLAVEASGGPTTLFGIALVVFSLQHVLVSQIAKAWFDQRPEARLDAPVATIGVYCVAAAGFIFGGLLARRFPLNRGRSAFRPIADPKLLARLAVAALGLALIRSAVLTIGGGGSDEGVQTGGILGPLRQLAAIETFAIACATAAVVIKSDRRQLIGPFNLVTLLVPLMLGLVGGHRSGTIAPGVVLLATGWAFGFRFRIQHAVILAGLAYVFLYIISPFGLAVRSQSRSGNFAQDLSHSANTLIDIALDPGGQSAKEEATARKNKLPPENLATRYFALSDNSQTNLLERFSLIKATDAIVNDTRRSGSTEWATITPGFLMLPPSILMPDKPPLGTGNMIAHRVPGWVNKYDYSTGITFGLVADSFGAFGWIGAFVIPLLTVALVQVMYRLFIQLELRGNVFALGLGTAFPIAFSETTVQTAILSAFQASIVVAVGYAIVVQLARLGEFGYLHPNRRFSKRPEEMERALEA